MEARKVILAEDDHDFANLLKTTLEKIGFKVDVVSNQKTLQIHLSATRYEMLILDLFLAGKDTISEVSDIQKRYFSMPIIMITAYGTIDLAVKSMQAGATTFIAKNAGITNIIAQIISNFPTEEEITSEEQLFPDELNLIGNSLAMIKTKRIISTLRNVNIPILIGGESGTGKEVAAKSIHLISTRSDKNFRAVNCGAIPDALLEAELFGHTKGAFTDAKNDRKGLFEVCSDGTLLLDEIGDMPLNLQVKLLRVLQEKEVTPIGGSTPKKINTCIIAASNKNLAHEVKKGNFREDLFYRLNVIRIELPPLRDRTGDIEKLLSHFLDQSNEKFNKNVSMPDRLMLKRLENYHWPGNVRQLRNAVERAVVLSKGDLLDIDLMLDTNLPGDELLGDQETLGKHHTLNLTEAKETFERDYLQNLLDVSKGNISDAARLAGRYRGDIYRLMNKHNVMKDDK